MQLKPTVQMFYTKGNISGDGINKAIFNACFSSMLCPLHAISSCCRNVTTIKHVTWKPSRFKLNLLLFLIISVLSNTLYFSIIPEVQYLDVPL